MKVSWKAIVARARIGNWSAMAWAMLVLVLVFGAGTMIVGIEMYAITEHPLQFNTQ